MDNKLTTKNRFMSNSSVLPNHICRAIAWLPDAGINVDEGTRALELSAAFYTNSPQMSQTDTLRKDRNRIQDELERVSQQLLDERQKVLRLEQELALCKTSLALPPSEDELIESQQRRNANALRRKMRDIAEALNHPQAKPESKISRVRTLVAGALAGMPTSADRMLGTVMLAKQGENHFEREADIHHTE
ncbi:MAG TPA: hypothetical protein VF630_16410 [Hymenobacter sp.]